MLDACRGNKFQLLSDFSVFHYSRALPPLHISHKPPFNRNTKHIAYAITRMHNELSILLHYFSIIWKHEKKKKMWKHKNYRICSTKWPRCVFVFVNLVCRIRIHSLFNPKRIWTKKKKSSNNFIGPVARHTRNLEHCVRCSTDACVILCRQWPVTLIPRDVTHGGMNSSI